MVKLTESIYVSSVHHLKNFSNDIITRLRTKISTLLNSFCSLYESSIPFYKVHLESVDVSSRVHMHLSEYSFELQHHIITHAKLIESSTSPPKLTFEEISKHHIRTHANRSKLQHHRLK